MSRKNRIRNLSTLVVALGLCGSVLAAGGDKSAELDKENAPVAPAQVGWVSYGEALRRAEAENKHIVIDFYTNWCGWCKVMDRKTYTDPAVVEMLNANFLIAKINAESSGKFAVGESELSGRDVAHQFGVRQFPMTWFVKPDGERLANIPGFIPPERFIKALEYVHERRYDKPDNDERQAKERQ